MKKIFSLTLLSLVLLQTANAVDSTGCGFGSTLWKGQQGLAPQILAVTTNGTSGSQTFGITSGTMGCDPNGRITGGTGRILSFLENNMDSFALDATKGEGETLDVLANLTGKSVEEVKEVVKSNLDYLFPNENAHVAEVTEKLAKLLNIA